jgi:hypothetical protein
MATRQACAETRTHERNATHPSVSLDEVDARFRRLGALRRALGTNGKQAPVILAGVGGSRRAWRTRAFYECARQHVGALWTLAALAFAQEHAPARWTMRRLLRHGCNRRRQQIAMLASGPCLDAGRTLALRCIRVAGGHGRGPLLLVRGAAVHKQSYQSAATVPDRLSR